MKATGIVRKIDDLGRLVIPSELRKLLRLDVGTPVEFYVEGNRIVLERYQRGCIFCGEVRNDVYQKGSHVICTDCARAALNKMKDGEIDG